MNIVKTHITRDDAAKLLRKWRTRRANRIGIRRGPFLQCLDAGPRTTLYAYHDNYGQTIQIITDRTPIHKSAGIISDKCELSIRTN